MEITPTAIRTPPIIRWAGGKSWLLPRLVDYIPLEFNNYHEPFFGGGSVFFNMFYERKCYVSDINAELVNFLVQLRDKPRELIRQLHYYKNTETSYYKVRSKKETDKVKSAARFYYLNRTCFNGLYRVNKLGDFNVPFGYRHGFEFVDVQALHSCSVKLKKAIIRKKDFAVTLKDVRQGDLVFIDPPYTVAHGNNGFIEYNQHIFSWEDQRRLAVFLREIHKKKAFYIMTNASHPSIAALYSWIGKKFEIERYSTIAAKQDSRKRISELIFTNTL